MMERDPAEMKRLTLYLKQGGGGYGHVNYLVKKVNPSFNCYL